MSAPFHFDPFDPAITQNMWDEFRGIREAHPVSRHGDFVFVARFEDAKAVLRKPLVFSSAQGFRAPGVVVPLEDKIVGELDPPHHQPIRRLLTSILVPKIVDRATPFTERVAAEQIEGMVARGGGDLVEGLSLLLPTQVTVDVLGLPEADAPQLAAWANELMHSEWPATNRTDRGEGLSGAFPEYSEYIDRQVAWRRSSPDPPDDLITGMVQKSVFGRAVSDRQIRTLVSNLLLGGIATSTSLLGNLMHHLLTHPDDFRALRDDSSRIPAAVEESLRLSPPILYVVRTCAEDTEIGGVPVKAGERVIVSIASANRDDAIYPDADTFRLDRDRPEPHLAFSAGPHLCVGAGLSRMEGRVVLEAFTQRFSPDTIALVDGYVFESTPVFMEYGPKTLPVVIQPTS
jgi:cytochrome P450